MPDYYFLTALLPPLELGRVPALGFFELNYFLSYSLNAADRDRVRDFRFLIDFENFRSFWASETIDPRGNLSYEQLERASSNFQWLEGEEMPWFLLEHLRKYQSSEERLTHFSDLMHRFFDYMIGKSRGFLHEFFVFHREMRWVLLGLRAKKLGYDIKEELAKEDPSDPIVGQLLTQSSARVYDPPLEYARLKLIMESFEKSPMELHKALYDYQYDYIVKRWGGKNPFGLERIFNYMARLILCEKWLELDIGKGIQIIDTIDENIA